MGHRGLNGFSGFPYCQGLVREDGGSRHSWSKLGMRAAPIEDQGPLFAIAGVRAVHLWRQISQLPESSFWFSSDLSSGRLRFLSTMHI